MNKFLVSLVFAISFITGAFAQSTSPTNTLALKGAQGDVSARSSTVTLTDSGLNLLWLNDGYDSLAAIAYSRGTVRGTNGRLSIQAIGAGDPNDLDKKAYLTLGLGFNVIRAASGFRVDLFGGPKGFNIADNFKLQSGKGAWVFGFGVSLPIGN